MVSSLVRQPLVWYHTLLNVRPFLFLVSFLPCSAQVFRSVRVSNCAQLLRVFEYGGKKLIKKLLLDCAVYDHQQWKLRIEQFPFCNGYLTFYSDHKFLARVWTLLQICTTDSIEKTFFFKSEKH